jgi:hypothetical protein
MARITLSMPFGTTNPDWGVVWMGGTSHFTSDSSGITVTYPTGISAAAAGVNSHFWPPKLQPNPLKALTGTYDILPDSNFDWNKGGKIGLHMMLGSWQGSNTNDPCTPQGNRFMFNASTCILMFEGIQGGKGAVLKAYVGPSSSVGTSCGGADSAMVKAQGQGFTSIATHLGQDALISLFVNDSDPLVLTAGKINSLLLSVKCNDPGHANGGVTIGVNGRYKSFNGMQWLAPSDSPFGISLLGFGTWFGGNGSDWAPRHVENIVFSNFQFTPAYFDGSGVPSGSVHSVSLPYMPKQSLPPTDDMSWLLTSLSTENQKMLVGVVSSVISAFLSILAFLILMRTTPY